MRLCDYAKDSVTTTRRSLLAAVSLNVPVFMEVAPSSPRPITSIEPGLTPAAIRASRTASGAALAQVDQVAARECGRGGGVTFDDHGGAAVARNGCLRARRASFWPGEIDEFGGVTSRRRAPFIQNLPGALAAFKGGESRAESCSKSMVETVAGGVASQLARERRARQPPRRRSLQRELDRGFGALSQWSLGSPARRSPGRRP